MFHKRSTRDIVASKRTAENSLPPDTKVIGKATVAQLDTAAPQQEMGANSPEKLENTEQPKSETLTGNTEEKSKKTTKWVLPLGIVCGTAVVIGLSALLIFGGKTQEPAEMAEKERSIIAVSAEAALADFVRPGDVVRLYDTDGSTPEPLQYVQVYDTTAFNEILLLVDDVQAAALVTESISPKMVVVSHKQKDKAAQMLQLQSRINDPDITLTLPQTQTLQPGESVQMQLKADIEPLEASLPPIQWETSDDSVISVDSNGLITANGVGAATITVTCGKVTAESKITVEIPLETIILDQTKTVLGVGETAALKPAPQPENATDFNVAWTSSDPGVVTVDEAGNMTAVSVGSATITATSGAVTAECSVVVGLRAEVVKLDTEALTLQVSQTAKLSGTIYPEGNVIDEAVFTSSDPNIATVAADGTVTALAAGSCTITFKAGNATAACTVTVTE